MTMKAFKKICKMNQETLKVWLMKVLKMKYKNIINGDGFLYARGNVPILLTAHMDTVHAETCKDIVVEKKDGKTILSSPQGIGGDDRCGIWIIYKIITRTKYRPYILFCEDEEIGGVGSDKFSRTEYIHELEDVKYLVELDRMNAKDAVYYDCGNEDFMDYIEDTIGYIKDYGSFSDIGHLSPGCDRASVNLGCGYYNQHTLLEYVVFEEMADTYKAVKKLLADADNAPTFDYQEITYHSRYGSGYFSSLLSRYEARDIFEFDEEDSTDELRIHGCEFIFVDESGKECSDYIDASSFASAVGLFLMDHPDIRYNDILDYYEY